MKKLSLISVLCLTALITAPLSFADCPAARTIYYYCDFTHYHKQCYWATEDACFEASSDGFGAKPGDKAGPFVKAIWSPYSGAERGASTCYYQGPDGEGIIKVFQGGGYGQVPKPTGSHWQTADKPDSLSCESDNVNDCPFKYCN